MGGGGSSTASTSTTQNLSQDNRVAADNGALALGQGATYTVNDQFDGNVSDAFSKLVDLVSNTVTAAGQIVVNSQNQQQKSNTDSLSAVGSAYNDQNLGTSQVFQNMIPLVLIAAVVVVVAWLFLRRK